jgi:endonuclease/exonuclease/phosphatase family metal-dependent hydrolase
MALFRHLLEGRLGQTTPAIIMGDFNCSAEDHKQELCSPYCLFAVSKRHRTPPRLETVMGQSKRAWRLVEPSCPSHVGTYYWQHTEAWSTIDHIVLTPDLYGLLGKAEVLTRLEGHSFLTEGKQVPRSSQFSSDHLPVVCTVDYR